MGYVSNTFKTIVLIALLTALVLWIGQLFGGTTGLVIAFAFVMLFNGIMYWYSDKIVLWMYRAKEAPKGDKLVSLVHKVAHKAGLPNPRVFIVESANPNAFATGRSPKHAAVAATTGILGLLDDEELEAVLAHEMTHVKNRDTLITTIAGVLAGVISYLAAIARWGAIFGGFGGDRDNGAGNLLSLVLIGILAPIIAMILQLAISRAREYMADAGSAKLMHSGKPLARALGKLEAGIKQHPMKGDTSHTATSSLFIANPFRGGMIVELFSTHPPMAKRIARLEAYRN